MSYDGWLQIDTGGAESATVAEIGNYTSNVSPMWRHALKMAGEDIRLSDTEGRTAGDVLPLLKGAHAAMELHPEDYVDMEPENGWGDYVGALQYLRNLVRLCEEHPKAYLHWWV